MWLGGNSRHKHFENEFELHATIIDGILQRLALSSRHVPPVLKADPAGSHLTGFLL